MLCVRQPNPANLIDIDVSCFAGLAKQRMHSAERMLELHRQLPKVQTPHEQEAIQRQIAATDKAIDALVYELYGLTEAEIAIAEGGGGK